MQLENYVIRSVISFSYQSKSQQFLVFQYLEGDYLFIASPFVPYLADYQENFNMSLGEEDFDEREEKDTIISKMSKCFHAQEKHVSNTMINAVINTNMADSLCLSVA
jgi:hypothetical protein